MAVTIPPDQIRTTAVEGLCVSLVMIGGVFLQNTVIFDGRMRQQSRLMINTFISSEWSSVCNCLFFILDLCEQGRTERSTSDKTEDNILVKFDIYFLYD